MIHSLSGKIFIRDHQKIPKNSYLIFIYGKHRLVYKSESVKYLTGDSAFTLEGSPIFDSVFISLETWELRIRDVPINNVRWFLVYEDGEKYKLKEAEYSSLLRPGHWILSALSFGLIGFSFLNKKNKEAHNLATRLKDTQRELCNSLSARKAENLQDTKEESDAAQLLKDEYGSLKGAHIALLNLKKDLLEAWTADTPFVTEEDIKWITKIKETYNSWEALSKILDNYQELEKNLQNLTAEEIEDAVNIKNTYGSIYVAQRELEKFFQSKEELDIILFLKQTYGSLQRVHDELLRYQRDILDLRTFKHSNVAITNKDAEWVIKIKDKYDSFESLFKTLEKYQELKDLTEGLTQEDIEEAIKIKKKLDDAHTSRVTLERIIESREELEALVLLRHEYGSMKHVKSELIEIEEDPEYLAEISEVHQSLEKTLSNLENFERDKGYSEGDIAEVIKIREKYASLSAARKDLEDYQQLKDQYGSTESIQELLLEQRKLQTRLTTEEIETAIQLKNSYGNLHQIEQELQEALELKSRYHNFKNIKKDLEDFQSLKDQYGNHDYIVYKLENSEDPERIRLLEESNQLISERNQILTSQLQQKIKDEEELKPMIDALKDAFKGNLDEMFDNAKLLASLQSKYGSLKEIEKKLEDLS